MEGIVSASKSEIARPISDFLLSGTAGQSRSIGQHVFQVLCGVGTLGKRLDGEFELSDVSSFPARREMLMAGVLHSASRYFPTRYPRPFLPPPSDFGEDRGKRPFRRSMEGFGD